MTEPKAFHSWMIPVMIDIISYCENEGLTEVAGHLSATMEKVAPLLHSRKPPACRSVVLPFRPRA